MWLSEGGPLGRAEDELGVPPYPRRGVVAVLGVLGPKYPASLEGGMAAGIAMSIRDCMHAGKGLYILDKLRKYNRYLLR